MFIFTLLLHLNYHFIDFFFISKYFSIVRKHILIYFMPIANNLVDFDVKELKFLFY